jgi:hypothetical protein
MTLPPVAKRAAGLALAAVDLVGPEEAGHEAAHVHPERPALVREDLKTPARFGAASLVQAVEAVGGDSPLNDFTAKG